VKQSEELYNNAQILCYKGNNMKVFAVIMAGGKEMRFGPIKKFLGAKSTLQLDGREEILLETITRCIGVKGISKDYVYIVTNAEQKRIYDNILSQKDTRLYRDVSIAKEHYFIEPEPKNTAPCILYAALKLKKKYPNEKVIMCVFPSDHDIPDFLPYRKTLEKAINIVSKENKMVTIGITPTFPATAYGYINFDETKGKIRGYYNVIQFKEKPDIDTAQTYIQSGNYLWNSGIFVWNIDFILSRFEKYFFEGYSEFKGIIDRDYFGPDGLKEDWAKAYRNVQRISVDYAILEKDPRNILVIPGKFKWQDIGKWDALLAIFSTSNNIIDVDILGVDTTNSTIYSSGKYIYGHETEFTFKSTSDSYIWLYCNSTDKEKVLQILERHGNYNIRTFESIEVDVLKKELLDLREQSNSDVSDKASIRHYTEIEKTCDPLIFLSHKSDDKPYADALEKFLIGLGIKSSQLIYTSHDMHRTPTNENFCDYLRNKIANNVFCIYLLSDKYFESPICLNEMGAAWVMHCDYIILTVPDFNFSNPKFESCVIDKKRQGIKLKPDDMCYAGMIDFKNKMQTLFKLKIDEYDLAHYLNHFIDDLKRIAETSVDH
jgi:mannose-1-phosphate guanylyltransferase